MKLSLDRKRQLYVYVTGRRFATHRLLFWVANLPPAFAFSGLRESVVYLVFLSIAALIESALTDVIQGWKAEVEE